MQIGGAEFTMGVSRETNDTGNFAMALKIVVFGMDTMETAQAVYERLSTILIDMDPELEIAEVKGDKAYLKLTASPGMITPFPRTTILSFSSGN